MIKEYKDMTPTEQEEYRKLKNEIITNYMGIPTTNVESLKLRTRIFLEETKSNFWK